MNTFKRSLLRKSNDENSQSPLRQPKRDDSSSASPSPSIRRRKHKSSERKPFEEINEGSPERQNVDETSESEDKIELNLNYKPFLKMGNK